MDLFLDIFKTFRPKQWVKNLILLAALIFSGNLFNHELLKKTLEAIVVFSMTVSAVYVVNDILDAPTDRLHPLKKDRPIASGKVPTGLAWLVAGVLFLVSLFLGQRLSNYFSLMLLVYFSIQLTYSFFLKHVVIFDVFAIAAGFVIRVYAGAFLINAHLSIWFLLGVISAALFLAVGKRRAELNILEATVAAKHRATLSRYTPELLDTYLAMMATIAFLSWTLFAFFEPQGTTLRIALLLSGLPLTLSGTAKWLMITIPVVAYGIMRYLSIIYQGSRAESPEKVLLSDMPLLAAVGLWSLMVVVIIYGVNP